MRGVTLEKYDKEHVLPDHSFGGLAEHSITPAGYLRMSPYVATKKQLLPQDDFLSGGEESDGSGVEESDAIEAEGGDAGPSKRENLRASTKRGRTQVKKKRTPGSKKLKTRGTTTIPTPCLSSGYEHLKGCRARQASLERMCDDFRNP